MNELPPELLIKIIKFSLPVNPFNPFDTKYFHRRYRLLSNYSRVNSQWKEISQDLMLNVLLLNFNNSKSSTHSLDSLISLLTKNDHELAIKVKTIWLERTNTLDKLPPLPNLTRLFYQLQGIPTFLSQFNQLTSLTLSSQRTNASHWHSLDSAILSPSLLPEPDSLSIPPATTIPSLTSLSFDLDTSLVLSQSYCFPNVTKVSTYTASLLPYTILNELTWLNNFIAPKMKELQFFQSFISDQALPCLTSGFSQFRHLTRLTVNNLYALPTILLALTTPLETLRLMNHFAEFNQPLIFLLSHLSISSSSSSSPSTTPISISKLRRLAIPYQWDLYSKAEEVEKMKEWCQERECEYVVIEKREEGEGEGEVGGELELMDW